MSIAILSQVYQDMRRLAIAGSVVASGDFRLKKLVPPLEQAGAKAPVFAKVAEAVKAVVDGSEKTSAESLLELTTLVNAILYTQGETGIPGTLLPIETTDLGAPTAQTSARVLKPLLEALTTTGAGRLELIRDAHERGAFRDLRLVKPALEAIDDPYGEVGDYVAEHVLPIYGKAIVPELHKKYDPKGRGGHPRRLRLMYQLDPAGSRELVKQALDTGSKEVKIIAIQCLGADREDLAYLLEQASAKAQDVRQAAYHALAPLNDDAALEALKKAITGKDLDIAVRAVQQTKSPKLVQFVIAQAEQEVAPLAGTKDKKEISRRIARAQLLADCLKERTDAASEEWLLKMFRRRAELTRIKGDTFAGDDLNSTIVYLLSLGSPRLRVALAEAHADLSPEELEQSFEAARAALPAERVFEIFSPYLTARVDAKKKQRDPAWARREAICQAIAGDHYYYWSRSQDTAPPLDPRWLDLAVGSEHLGLVRQLCKPGHVGAEAFLKKTFDATLKKSKSLDECHEVIAAMVGAGHPDATDAFVATLEKHAKKAHYYFYWFTRMTAELPPSAIPKLEALLPSLPEKVADGVLDGIQQLRAKAPEVPLPVG